MDDTPSIGYSFVHQAIVLSNPTNHELGRAFIAAKYKKKSTYTQMTADNAANTFPIERHEPTFKEVLKWTIRGMPTEGADARKFGMILAAAKRNETPGFQDYDAGMDLDDAYANLGI